MIQLVHSSRATEVSHQPLLYGVRRLTYEATEHLLIAIDAVNRDEGEYAAADEADEELDVLLEDAEYIDEDAVPRQNVEIDNKVSLKVLLFPTLHQFRLFRLPSSEYAIPSNSIHQYLGRRLLL